MWANFIIALDSFCNCRWVHIQCAIFQTDWPSVLKVMMDRHFSLQSWLVLANINCNSCKIGYQLCTNLTFAQHNWRSQFIVLMPSVRIYNVNSHENKEETLNERVCPNFWLVMYVYLVSTIVLSLLYNLNKLCWSALYIRCMSACLNVCLFWERFLLCCSS